MASFKEQEGEEMKIKTAVCKCDHSKYEHNTPSNWNDSEDTFCFHEFCTCPKFDPIEVDMTKDEIEEWQRGDNQD